MGILPADGNSAPDRLRAVLLDLDDTLFDHAHATRGALSVLTREDAGLAAQPFDDLVSHHSLVLEDLHTRVLIGEITVDEARIERFRRLLEAAGSARAADRAVELAVIYRRAYETDWRAVPGALDLLDAIRAAGLRAVIVTNNGVAEQRRKLDRCGIGSRIDAMVTSEEVGTSKPDPAIFDVALAEARAERDEVVMIGDAWATDVMGAVAAGIRPIWFNRLAVTSPDAAIEEIRSLAPTDDVMRRVRPGPNATGYGSRPLRAVP